METKQPRTIIALTGPARCGKDTVANILVEKANFVRIGLADKLKESLYQLNPLVLSDDSNAAFHEIWRLADIIDTYGWEQAKDQFSEVRALLQRLGSEAGWMIHGPNLWPNAAMMTINELDENTPIVISDLRFPAEQKWLKEQNGIIIAIERPGIETALGKNSNHISEKGISNPDYTISNDGTVDDLEIKVTQLLRIIKKDSHK